MSATTAAFHASRRPRTRRAGGSWRRTRLRRLACLYAALALLALTAATLRDRPMGDAFLVDPSVAGASASGAPAPRADAGDPGARRATDTAQASFESDPRELDAGFYVAER